MRSMATLKAVVQGGRVVVQDHVDLPDGTELQLEVIDGEDELDTEEQAELLKAVEESRAEEKAGDRCSSGICMRSTLRATPSACAEDTDCSGNDVCILARCYMRRALTMIGAKRVFPRHKNDGWNEQNEDLQTLGLRHRRQHEATCSSGLELSAVKTCVI